ncbi:MAG: hypothetical protein PVS3B3_36220 [Ktedonobacteraceae bacterium]
MNNEIRLEETSLEELANISLSELVEPQNLDMPQIEAQDLDLPYDYIEDLMQRGVIGEDRSTIAIDSRLLEGLEPELSPIEPETPMRDNDLDFGHQKRKVAS